MSTLTDLIAEALREHPDATDRSADDGCWCRTPGTAGRYNQHAAAIIAAAVADWLESEGTVRAAEDRHPARLGSCCFHEGQPGHRCPPCVTSTSMATALAAEARKGADQ